MDSFTRTVFIFFAIFSTVISSPVTNQYVFENSTDISKDNFTSVYIDAGSTINTLPPYLQESSDTDFEDSIPQNTPPRPSPTLSTHSPVNSPPNTPLSSPTTSQSSPTFPSSSPTSISLHPSSIPTTPPATPSTTLHQSPPTLHQSPTTFHQAPPTFHQSPTTYYQSPTTSHQAPLTLHQSPTTLHQTPPTISLAPPTIKPISQPNCPDLENGDSLTQITFLDRLTAPCRYDRLTRPGGDVRGARYRPREASPVNVHVQLDIRHVEAAENLQFKMHMLLQYRYRDDRLNYSQISPGRAKIVGEEHLRERIWIPHVLLENEKESTIMGHDVRDIYMAIEPNGEVTYSRRIKTTLYCWMNLQKFPFDEQDCDIKFLSWTYNASELMLRWEEHEPVVIANQLHLTEYTLMGHWTEGGIKQGSRQNRGAFTGNYSCLTFRFHMAREMGFYMLDYFIPSIMLVCISWVSFWLQADASAPRITIGTSTMLSFITLATAQTRTLPKVSYIKASEIWFLACTCFIFGSMVEFAFVNIIWRRKSNVEFRKVNSKHILKSTLTPRLHRKDLMKGSGLQKSHSCSSLDNASTDSKLPQYNNYLTVHAGMNLPRITTESVDDLIEKSPSTDSISLTVPGIGGMASDPNGFPNQFNPNHQTFTTMTPQEIAQWIDKRSRLVFPCAFLVFNAFYWGFVYWL